MCNIADFLSAVLVKKLQGIFGGLAAIIDEMINISDVFSVFVAVLIEYMFKDCMLVT